LAQACARKVAKPVSRNTLRSTIETAFSMMTLFGMVCLLPLATWGLQLSVPAIDEATNTRSTVWIASLMRSGSSTLLEMMYANETHDNQYGGEVFSLFEPCHRDDSYSPQLGNPNAPGGIGADCAKLALAVSKCDFSQIKRLAKWDVPRTTNDHKRYSEGVAEKKCREAKLIAIKTVEPFHLENVTWVLDKNPHMKMIWLVRDPRGMYASNRHGGGSDIEQMVRMCDFYEESSHVRHPRLKSVVFEDLVRHPEKVTKSIFNFIGRHYGDQQKSWLKATFNADCDDQDNATRIWSKRYGSCHEDSKSVATKWRKELSSKEKKAFSQSEVCKNIARQYKFHEIADAVNLADDDEVPFNLQFEIEADALAED